jgi:hypothetical protein
MMSAAAALIVLLIPVAVLVGFLMLIEARQQRSARIVARQIMLTDAVHAELGAELRSPNDLHIVFTRPPHAA